MLFCILVIINQLVLFLVAQYETGREEFHSGLDDSLYDSLFPDLHRLIFEITSCKLVVFDGRRSTANITEVSLQFLKTSTAR